MKNIIDNLSDNKSFGILTELESPQNYRMGEIETLHKLKIPPIVRLPKELRLSAQDLGTYIDFLAQMTQTREWVGQRFAED